MWQKVLAALAIARGRATALHTSYLACVISLIDCAYEFSLRVTCNVRRWRSLVLDFVRAFGDLKNGHHEVV